MKKTLLVLFIFFPFFLFSQENIINNNYENFIKIEPTEVYSSAIFIFEFINTKVGFIIQLIFRKYPNSLYF